MYVAVGIKSIYKAVWTELKLIYPAGSLLNLLSDRNSIGAFIHNGYG
jgi:hypothetical protein